MLELNPNWRARLQYKMQIDILFTSRLVCTTVGVKLSDFPVVQHLRGDR